ncbi:hypothetical protein PQR68_34455 [Paraburkholderia agricolaris]|uniref:hypothetical protein n=1 Tax=Paraburkholderia agricolaris TaxID=2152888 RepID=UPI0038B88B97
MERNEDGEVLGGRHDGAQLVASESEAELRSPAYVRDAVAHADESVKLIGQEFCVVGH